MTKSELIKRLAEKHPELYQRDIEKLVSTIFDCMRNKLRDCQRIELRGFGAFSVRERDGRQARNPRTGEQVKVDKRCTPYFRMGKQLRQRLNGDFEDEAA